MYYGRFWKYIFQIYYDKEKVRMKFSSAFSGAHKSIIHSLKTYQKVNNWYITNFKYCIYLGIILQKHFKVYIIKFNLQNINTMYSSGTMAN